MNDEDRDKNRGKPERSPYSPRTFRRPDETEEEWKRRKNRGKKARYLARHADRVHAQKNRAYARRSKEIQEQRSRNRQAQMPKVSAEELERLRLNILDSIQQEGIICLQCGVILRRLTKHLKAIHRITDAEFRETWGFNRRTALCSGQESAKTAKTAQKRHWGTRLVPYRFKAGQVNNQPEDRSRRQEARLKIGKALKGIQRPNLWKQHAGGVVTNMKIAQERLSGKTVEAIAKKFGMSIGSISVRLGRLGFNNRDIAFDRGAVVTGRIVRDLCEEFGLKREEISRLLFKNFDWASGHTSEANLDKPLSAEMAGKVLKLREQLRRQHRQAASAKGGRPRSLLPSEERDLPGKYRDLQQDLNLLKDYLKAEPKADRAKVWDWLCRVARKRRLRVLFFMPEFFKWMEANYDDLAFKPNTWSPGELCLTFLAESYNVSEITTRRTVFRTGSAQNTLNFGQI